MGRRFGVPSPALLEPLAQHAAERLVQRVDREDRRRVVVGRRALDPVALEQQQVERERHRRAARAQPLHRPLGHRHRRHPGRRRQALLGARVGEVHAPVAHLERHAGERGDAVGHQQRVAVAQQGAELGQRVLDPGRGLGMHHGDHPRPGFVDRAPPSVRRSKRTHPSRPSTCHHARRHGAERSQRSAGRRSRTGRRSPCRPAPRGSRSRPPCRPCPCSGAAAPGRPASGTRAAAGRRRRAGSRASSGRGGRASAASSRRARRDPRSSGRGRRAAALAVEAGGERRPSPQGGAGSP